MARHDKVCYASTLIHPFLFFPLIQIFPFSLAIQGDGFSETHLALWIFYFQSISQSVFLGRRMQNVVAVVKRKLCALPTLSYSTLVFGWTTGLALLVISGQCLQFSVSISFATAL